MKAVRRSVESSFTAAKLLAAIAVSSAALCASAATYYWKPGATQGQWTTIENWSTESATGATASALPGSGDSLAPNQSYNFNLAGGTYTLVGLYDGNDTQTTFAIENGTLKFSSEVRRESTVIDINSGATLHMLSTSTLYPGCYAYHGGIVNVNDGGSLVVEGTARFYKTTYNVLAGGSLTYTPSTMRISCEAHNYASALNNSGTINLPNGMVLNTFDSASANAGASFTFSQNAGTMNLGGPITKGTQPGIFNVELSGGTVNVTGDATFNVTSVSLENSVTFNVDSGKTVNLSPVAFASGSSIVKTGDGSVILPATAPTATISAGKLALSAATYDLTAVTFGSDSIIDLTAMGARIDSAGASIENATFEATIPATAGTDVLYSTNPTILQYAKADLDASVPAGFDLVISGEALSVEAETAGSFTGNGDICDAEGWGGTIPAAGSDVSIDGADAIATYSGGDMPAWNSIEVKNGATLRIASNLTLPKIILNKNAKLEIVNSASVTLGNVADLTGVVAATPELVIPELVVEAGATLNVPGGMKFSNVNISLAGTIETTTSGGVTFGYANNGETTYIGFAANGGTIAITEGSGSTYDLDPIEFCCPQSGSSVVAVGDLVLNEANLPKSSGGYDYMTGRMVGFHLGRNNSEDMSFNVVFNNTKWGTSGKLYICGGATFSLTNNSSFITYEHHTQWDRYAEISGKGRLYLGEGSEFRLNSLGNYGDRTLVVNQSVSGHNAVVVEHGAIFENYRWTGNNNGVFSVSNGVYRIFEPYIIENEELKSVNTPFDGLRAVNIADDSVLTFTTRNQANGHGYFNNGDDRVVSLANVPITGAGSIALDNANVNKFGVIVTCGSNTATGSASVVAPGEGEGETTLYFADGANWAGTVTAGNVALTNLVDSAAACTNTFNRLDLAAGTTFPIRVWKTGGVIVAHDGLNVGSYVNNGGKIVLVAMDEALAPGDSFILGTVGDDSKPAIGGKWEARAENGVLKVKYSSGLTVILR